MKRILLASQTDSIELTLGEHVIGRDVGCQLRFNDNSVSRRHVLIRVAADAVSVEDLGSRNGTYLNGRLVVSPRPLRDGDEIRIGRRVFRVHVLGDGETGPDEDTATDPVGAQALRRFAQLIENERRARRSEVPPMPAQVTCPGCRGSVSITLENCPSCGRPRRNRALGITQTLPPSVVEELATAAEDLLASNDKADRRRSRRHPVDLPLIYISDDLMFEAVGTDLSAHGVFVATELLDELGSPCSVTLLPDGTGALHLKGRVARVVERGGSGSGFGVEFDLVKPADHAALARIIGLTRAPK